MTASESPPDEPPTAPEPEPAPDELLEARVARHLVEIGASFEIVPCDPALADTAAFCAHYGFAPERSANCIVVVGKGAERRYAACVVLATTRLDVNGVVRRRLGVKKCSFASASETIAVSDGMHIGGVTPFGLPAGLAVWVDRRVLEVGGRVIVGGGSRATKVLVDPAIFATMERASDGVVVVDDLAIATTGHDSAAATSPLDARTGRDR